VDCPELQELLLYISQQLKGEDIPHRTKMGQLIVNNFKMQYNVMVEGIQVVCPPRTSSSIAYKVLHQQFNNLLVRFSHFSAF